MSAWLVITRRGPAWHSKECAGLWSYDRGHTQLHPPPPPATPPYLGITAASLSGLSRTDSPLLRGLCSVMSLMRNAVFTITITSSKLLEIKSATAGLLLPFVSETVLAGRMSSTLPSPCISNPLLLPRMRPITNHVLLGRRSTKLKGGAVILSRLYPPLFPETHLHHPTSAITNIRDSRNTLLDSVTHFLSKHASANVLFGILFRTIPHILPSGGFLKVFFFEGRFSQTP